MEISGTTSFLMMEKLKPLKVNLRHWNRESFGRVEERNKLALKTVAQCDAVESQRVLSIEEKEKKVKAFEEFKRWVFMEELSWRQKSREIWLKGTITQAISMEWLMHIGNKIIFEN